MEGYWDKIASYGERFTAERATAMLLHNVRRYEAALVRIGEKPAEQEALTEHRGKAFISCRNNLGREVYLGKHSQFKIESGRIECAHSTAKATGRSASSA